jgi:hypothetical protein
LFETFLIFKTNGRDVIKNYIGIHVKHPLFLYDFNYTNFLERFPKNYKVPNLMKIRPVGAELFHAYEQTDMTKLIIAFRNFAKAPKFEIFLRISAVLKPIEDQPTRIGTI